jgi:hypothetical protein
VLRRSSVTLTVAGFVLFLIAIASVAPLFAAGKGDPCREKGIVVRNATMLNLWYKKNDGQCTIWIHEHLVTIKPEDGMKIFSGMDCTVLYCKNNPAYKEYRSVDTNGNCRVRILPDCRLSDM